MNINLLLFKNVVNQSVTALAYQPEIRLANIVNIVKRKNETIRIRPKQKQ